MNIKNIFLMFAIAIHLTGTHVIASDNDLPQGLPIWRIRQMQGLPSDPNKTPTDPDVVENFKEFLFVRNFSQKKIFFGTDENGEPCYKRIWEHEKDNPEFGKVTLVIFKEGLGFEVIGIYSDEKARDKLIYNINNTWFGRGKGGLWLPKEKTFIAGTRDPRIRDRFVEFLKNPPQTHSKFCKI